VVEQAVGGDGGSGGAEVAPGVFVLLAVVLLALVGGLAASEDIAEVKAMLGGGEGGDGSEGEQSSREGECFLCGFSSKHGVMAFLCGVCILVLIRRRRGGVCSHYGSVSGGGDGDNLGEGIAAKAVRGDGHNLDGDFHAEGGCGELGEVGGGQVGDEAVQVGKAGDLAELFGVGLGDTGGEGAGGEDENGCAEDKGANFKGEGGGILGGVTAEGEGRGWKVALGGDGEGGKLADEVGLDRGIKEDAALAGVEADAIKRLENDKTFGGQFGTG